MRAVNIHEAKTHLSRLVAEAVRGNAFVIAKAGKPLVKVVPYSETEPEPGRRLGFLAGEVALTSDHALAVEGLPALHRDPFDRILVAQAGVEGMRLVTADSVAAVARQRTN
jgi:prevent-host-death family protein